MARRNAQSLIIAGGLGVLTLAAVVAGIFDAGGLALACLGALVGATGLLVLAALARITNVSAAVRRDTAGKSTPVVTRDSRSEAGERRVLAILEAERLRAADRHRELLAVLGEAGAAAAGGAGGVATDRVIEATRSSVHRAVTELIAAGRDQTRAVEALFQLMGHTDFEAPMPPSGRWAMDARSLLELSGLIKESRPSLVVELGGGTSTVWTGRLLKEFGGRVVSIDHDAQFAEITRWNVGRHGIGETVEVRLAPLALWPDGAGAPWYDTSAFEDLKDIDLLIVDGPPATVATDARFPALPAFSSRLADGAYVVLDDADRPAEMAAVERWLAEFPALQRVTGDFGQLAVLRWDASGRC